MGRKQTNNHIEIRIPEGLAEPVLPIARETHRIHEAVLWSAQGQFEQCKLWRMLNVLLGAPAAALAALAGGAGLASDEQLPFASILALISAALAATLTTLNPSRRITQAQASGNAYLEVQTAARQLLTIDLFTLGAEEAREQLEELTVRRDEINKTADPPGTIARRRAAQVIYSGGQAYEIDKSAGIGG